MKIRRIVLAAFLLASVAPTAGATTHDADPADGSACTSPGPDLYLSGPFGRVAGGPVTEPALAQPGDKALDAYTRSAPFVVDIKRSESIDAHVTARAISSDGDNEQTLSRGRASFEGPAATGEYVVVVDVETPAGMTSQRAWLVHVPDRDPPEDGLYDIAAPDVLLEATASSVAGTPGDGCYLYLCADLGFPTPVDQLATLAVEAGEPLTARLSDGSGILAWDGRLEPLVETSGSSREGIGVLTAAVSDSVSLAGLDAPPPGTWLLRLTIVFDRERGQIEASYRLVSR